MTSSDSVDVAYAGPPLPAASELQWRVRVWDETGAESEWSEPARFRTALGRVDRRVDRAATAIHDPAVPVPGTDEELDETDFADAAPVAVPVPAARVHGRRRRAARDAVRDGARRGRARAQRHPRRRRGARARLDRLPRAHRVRRARRHRRCCATARTRSARSSATAGTPGFVGFDARRPGNHYGREPELLCELHLEHADGTREIVASDARWRATTGPLVYSDLLMGERYDARRELGPWQPASRCARATRVRLVPERAQPIRVTEELRAGRGARGARRACTSSTSARTWSAGRGLRVAGERGTRVQLRFAEMLEPDGSLYLANLRSARQLDTYVLAGDGVEEFEPRFTFHGFRYVEVTGIEDFELTGCVVHSDTPRSGAFECSDAMVNQLWRNINWGQRGNFLSVPTDCPQRDERLGWLADAQVFLPTATLNMDVAAFITKWGDDLLDAQSPDGVYPDVAPRLVFERDGARRLGGRRGSSSRG